MKIVRPSVQRSWAYSAETAVTGDEPPITAGQAAPEAAPSETDARRSVIKPSAGPREAKAEASPTTAMPTRKGAQSLGPAAMPTRKRSRPEGSEEARSSSLPFLAQAGRKRLPTAAGRERVQNDCQAERQRERAEGEERCRCLP